MTITQEAPTRPDPHRNHGPRKLTCFRLSEDERAALEAVARAEGTTKTEIVVRGIRAMERRAT